MHTIEQINKERIKKDIVVCPVCEGMGVIPLLNRDGSCKKAMNGSVLTELCGFCQGEHAVLRQVTTEYFHLSPAVVEEERKKGLFSWVKRN